MNSEDRDFRPWFTWFEGRWPWISALLFIISIFLIKRLHLKSAQQYGQSIISSVLHQGRSVAVPPKITWLFSILHVRNWTHVHIVPDFRVFFFIRIMVLRPIVHHHSSRFTVHLRSLTQKFIAYIRVIQNLERYNSHNSSTPCFKSDYNTSYESYECPLSYGVW